MPTATDIMNQVGFMLDKSLERLNALPSRATILKYSTPPDTVTKIVHRKHRRRRSDLYSKETFEAAHILCRTLRPFVSWTEISRQLKIPIGTLYKWQESWGDIPPCRVDGKLIIYERARAKPTPPPSV